MIDTLLNISVIDGGLNICRHRREYPNCTILDAVRQLQDGPTFLASSDYPRAVTLGEAVGWDAFVIEGSRRAQLRETLRKLALRLRPLWVRFAFLGRQRALRVADEDTRQCLDYAGLLEEPPTPETLAWWDAISHASRSAEEQRKVEVGRAGELLTLAHERARLRREGIFREPIWLAINDIGTGFDVMSFRRDDAGRIGELQIEVKASAFSPTYFILTRNEWEVAYRSAHRHIFHIWNLETAELRQLTVENMAIHIPVDRGHGKWREVKVSGL